MDPVERRRDQHGGLRRKRTIEFAGEGRGAVLQAATQDRTNCDEAEDDGGRDQGESHPRRSRRARAVAARDRPAGGERDQREHDHDQAARPPDLLRRHPRTDHLVAGLDEQREPEPRGSGERKDAERSREPRGPRHVPREPVERGQSARRVSGDDRGEGERSGDPGGDPGLKPPAAMVQPSPADEGRKAEREGREGDPHRRAAEEHPGSGEGTGRDLRHALPVVGGHDREVHRRVHGGEGEPGYGGARQQRPIAGQERPGEQERRRENRELFEPGETGHPEAGARDRGRGIRAGARRCERRRRDAAPHQGLGEHLRHEKSSEPVLRKPGRQQGDRRRRTRQPGLRERDETDRPPRGRREERAEPANRRLAEEAVDDRDPHREQVGETRHNERGAIRGDHEPAR